MTISGGSNVYAQEVEDVLLRHPAVHEAAVFGVPDRLWGEAVTAVVVGAPGVPADTDALPRNSYGKVLKRELRERYGAR